MYSVPDVSGKTFIITGSNSGLGKEAAQRLSSAGAHIIVAVRNTTKGQEAIDEIKSRVPSAQLSLEELDLSSLESVKNFSEKIKKTYPVIDGLMNNAGVMTPPKRTETTDGFELQFGTNYLGHFALTYRLLPHILKAPAPRVVTLSSIAANWGRIRFDDLNYSKRPYVPPFSYGQSKLADALLAVQLANLADKYNWNLLSVGAHPGVTKTNLQYAGSRLDGRRSLMSWFNDTMYALNSQSVDVGTEPQLFAMADPSVKNGDYYGPDGFLQSKGETTKLKYARGARNHQTAQTLYQESLKLVGIEEKDFLSEINS